VDHYDFGDPNVKPEKINNFELGYIGDFPQYFTLFSLKAYLEQIRDGIAEVEDTSYTGGQFISDTSLWEWTNSTQADIRGVEFEFKYMPSYKTFFHFQYSFAQCLDCTWVRYMDEQHPDHIRDVSQSVPRHTMSLLAQRVLVSDWTVAAAYYAMSKMRWLEDGSLLDAYDRWDVIFGYSRKFRNIKLKSQLVVQNLLGNYNEFNLYNNFETRVFIKLSADIY
jgi:iron complex outermembrane receptor protein